jgi:hypothetical protein
MDDTFLLHKEHSKFAPGKSKLINVKLYTWGDHNRHGGWLWNLFVTLPLAFVFGWILLNHIQEELKFHNEGITTTATVVDCERVASESRSGVIGLRFNYRYTIVTETGSQNYTSSDYIYHDPSFQFCEQLPAQFAVQHLSDPLAVRITEGSLSRVSWDLASKFIVLPITAIIVVLASAILMTLVTGEIVFRKWQTPLLEREGKLLDGEITKVRGWRNYDGYYLMTIDYQFTVQKGTQRGTFTQLAYVFVGDLPPIGTPITVLYANRFCHIPL